MSWLLLFAVGLAVGSFLNVLIDRLPQGQDVIRFPSHCDYCKKPLRWFELIPLVSYLLQRGRCLRCHRRLSLQYPLIELATATTFFLIAQAYYHSNIFTAENILNLSLQLIIASSFLVIFVADLKYQIIPDSMLLISFFAILAQHLLPFTYFAFLIFLTSGLTAGLFFYLLWWFTKGKGMGFGDVKLAFVLGWFLGYPGIIIAFYAAFLTGALVSVILILAGLKQLKSKIALGPFLIWGTLVAVFWGQAILNWWQKFS